MESALGAVVEVRQLKITEQKQNLNRTLLALGTNSLQSWVFQDRYLSRRIPRKNFVKLYESHLPSPVEKVLRLPCHGDPSDACYQHAWPKCASPREPTCETSWDQRLRQRPVAQRMDHQRAGQADEPR